MNKYRTIYEQHYGPIPKDKDGRTYEVHHKDGNHKNDSPENLQAITLQEHYDIHYARGDWSACHRMSARMKLSPKEISDLATKIALAHIKDGTHNFLTKPDGTSLASSQVAAGTHNFLTRSDGSSMSLDKVSKGIHNFQIVYHCDRDIKGMGNYIRWHNDNCRNKPRI